MDVGVFHQTKFMNGIYTRGSAGYRVVAMLAPNLHRDGVILFYQDFPNFTVKAIHHFGANIIACQLATGKRRWYIVGCYLVPGDRVIIWNMEEAMTERTRGEELIVAGGFNLDL